MGHFFLLFHHADAQVKRLFTELMLNDSFLGRIRQLAQEVSVREGCTLYDLEFGGGGGRGGRTLRVFIDRDGEQGVSIEDCSNVSRGLNLLLDVEDIIPGGAYSLEVSSPGLERVLRERWHFEKVIGQTISLKSFAPLIDFNPERADLAKARQLMDTLTGVDEKGVRVQAGESDVFIPFESITKAHLVFEFEGSQKGPQKGGQQGKKQGGKKPKKKSRR